MSIENVQKYIDVLVPASTVVSTLPSKSALIEVGELHVFNVGTKNTVFDLNCFIDENECSSEKTMVDTAFGLELAVHRKLPIDIALSVPTIRVNAFEMANAIDDVEIGSPIAYVDVVGADYSMKSNSSGRFILLTQLSIPNLRRGINLLRPDDGINDTTNVTFKFVTQKHNTLLESVLSKFMFKYTLDLTPNMTSDSRENKTISDIRMHTDLATDAETITATTDIEFRMRSPIDFSIAGATLDIWPYSTKSVRRRRPLGHNTPALDACYPQSTASACQVATLTWSPIAVKKDMISQISVIISLQGSAELLEDITSSILHRDIVNIRTKGTFSLPSYSGPLLRTNDEVSMWIHLPTLKKSEDSAQDISEENVEASGGINGIKLTRLTSIGDGAINLPCLFQDKDCINPSTMLAHQGVSVGSTLNVSLPRIDFNFGFTFQISLPNLGLSTSLSPIRRVGDVIERSETWPIGKVVLNGVSHGSTDGDTFAADLDVHFENASTFRKVQDLSGDVIELMFFVQGTQSTETLLNKIVSHINENFTLKFNSTGNTNSNDPVKEKPQISVNMKTDQSSVVIDGTFKLNESDYRLAIDTLIPTLNANIYSSVSSGSEKRCIMSFVTSNLLFQSSFGGSTTMQLRTF